VPAIHGFLSAAPSPTVIAGLDPAIHAMTLPLALRGDFARRPLQLRQFFGTVMAWIPDRAAPRLVRDDVAQELRGVPRAKRKEEIRGWPGHARP
jgi:hypothetical protein